jgi:hypothetical protein
MAKTVLTNMWPIAQLINLPNTVYHQWAARYRAFLQHRFVLHSRGGGDWPPLKRKRKRGAKKRAAILRDTNTLFNVLSVAFVNNPGQLQENIPDGIRVGFGGSGLHPGKGTMTVARLAEIHHFGLGNMPERQIIVDPDDEVQRKMASDVERYWSKVLGR